MKRTIEEVLDEMIGANYMITAAQIEEIREIHKCEINEALITATGLAEEAYEAGRKHDRKGFEEAVDYGRKRIMFAFGSRQRRQHDRPKLEALLLKNSIPQGIKDEKTT